MALAANKVSNGPIVTYRTIGCRSHEKLNFLMSTRNNRVQLPRYGVQHGQLNHICLLVEGSTLSNEIFGCMCRNPVSLISKRSFLCKSSGSNNIEEKECVTTYMDVSDLTSVRTKEEKDYYSNSGRGLAEACRFVCNDAKFVNERARHDIVLLSRILKLEARARQDVAFLGTEFLKLDARAREDTERIDRDVKKRVERLNRIASFLKDQAQSTLKSAADKHWSDGALEADLRLADFRAKQRAMEDALMALEVILYVMQVGKKFTFYPVNMQFVKNIHDMMVRKMYKFPSGRDKGSLSENGLRGRIRLEKNGKTIDFFPGDVSTDRIMALQEAYWSMASALSEADGIDYTDPEELELLITTLIDLDAMDGKQSVSLLAECSSSPDVSTRQALANALAAAPSMWTLGNAGMGALQRLAEDTNLAIAAAASKAIYELKKQWEIEEGDSWTFVVNENTLHEKESGKFDNEGENDKN
ncbi:senescence-associated protein AAF, chlorolplastic-like isoform X2 [Neltuma alba]|uniref:senescence-associated protein AAF, chlorolplastic isoform X2 n=1 Tax=Neltuma alba TaxID=207710 RepID=UPI0010A2B40D|nr:senescence-associated protein AAF, chlorolplastic-like isoform X2 [Prosopis alba]XP_028798498.1 senescence-associated protein AAF, chlorolplastic-like isoform X2 [Prosopis alba]